MRKKMNFLFLAEHNVLCFIFQAAAWSEGKVTMVALNEPVEALIVAQQ